jgi:hypothetical protein
MGRLTEGLGHDGTTLLGNTFQGLMGFGIPTATDEPFWYCWTQMAGLPTYFGLHLAQGRGKLHLG